MFAHEKKSDSNQEVHLAKMSAMFEQRSNIDFPWEFDPAFEKLSQVHSHNVDSNPTAPEPEHFANNAVDKASCEACILL